jgi:hypothetical protein
MVVPMGPVWKLLQGLGYVTTEPRKVLVRISDDYVERLYSKHKFRMLYNVTVMQSIPFKFHELVKSEYYYVPNDLLAPMPIDDEWNTIREIGYISSDSNASED